MVHTRIVNVIANGRFYLLYRYVPLVSVMVILLAFAHRSVWMALTPSSITRLALVSYVAVENTRLLLATVQLSKRYVLSKLHVNMPSALISAT